MFPFHTYADVARLGHSPQIDELEEALTGRMSERQEAATQPPAPPPIPPLRTGRRPEAARDRPDPATVRPELTRQKAVA